MTRVNFDWVREQFDEAKVGQAVGTSVLRLLEVWDTMNHTNKTANEAVEIFSKVALGHALVEPDVPAGTWVQATPGFIHVADIVRIRADAFTGEVGTMHNGRLGRVVGVRSGDIIVKSTDGKEPELDGAHYSPFHLEKLMLND